MANEKEQQTTKSLYTSDALNKMFGEQLKKLRKFDRNKLAKAIENRLSLGEENMPKGFAGLLSFNVPILQSDLKPYLYEDKFGRGAAPTDTYFVKSNGCISAIIKIIGQDTCIGPIDEVPDSIHVFSIDELQSKITETIDIFQGEIDRLKKAEDDEESSDIVFSELQENAKQLMSNISNA